MKHLALLLAFLIPTVVFSQSYTICGYINDRKNGENLIGAVALVKSKAIIATTTNQYGFYSLTLPKGSYELVYSFIGYQEQAIILNLTDNKTLNIGLEEVGINLDEAFVSSTKGNENIRQSKMGVSKINVLGINKLPVIFGERDILKTLQLLPGIKSGGDGQSGFTVRGGSIDQNLILLDEAPVYNASHLLGFFSTFNSDAIKDVSLYKGTAPAQFGGRISSVVDVKMNEGDNQNYVVGGGIGLISSKLNVEGPIQKGKSSFLISGRRTYADVFLKLDEQFKDNQLYFYDLNAKFNYRFSDKDQLFVSGYFGRDVLGLKEIFGINWGNATATIRWNHLYNSKLFSNTSFLYSNYDYKVEIQNNANPFSILSRIRDWNLKQEYQYFPNIKSEWKFGYNLIYHTITPGKITIADVTKNPDIQKDGYESALYASNDWQMLSRLKINYGLRLSYFIATKNQNNLQKSYLNIEPRISMSYTINDYSSFKMAYTRNTQNLHLITNSITTSPTDIWVMSTNNIKPEIGNQISVGYFRNINQNMFEFSAEAYYKLMDNQIDYKDNADERAVDIETQLLYGKGQAYGLEILLRKNKGKLTGWLGYTFSRSEKK